MNKADNEPPPPAFLLWGFLGLLAVGSFAVAYGLTTTWNFDWPRGINRSGPLRVFTHRVPLRSIRMPAANPPG